MIRKAIVLFFASVSLACANAPAASVPAEHVPTLAPWSVDDSVMLDAAAMVIAAASEVAAIWPGYWPDTQAFVFRPFAGNALLIAPVPPVPVEAVALNDAAVPAALHGIAWLYPDSTPERMAQSFDIAYRVGTRTVPAVGILPADTTNDRTWLLLFYLYHEAFHGYQEAAFADGVDAFLEPAIDPVVLRSPDFRAALAVERRLLSQAIAADDHDVIVARARDYLSVRAYRLKDANEIEAAEAMIERKEGSADYVAYAASLLARHGSNVEMSNAMVRNLADPRFEESVHVAARYRSQLYVTGASIALILDRLGYEWQSGLAAGRSFPAMLAEAAGWTWPVVVAGDIESLLARHDYHGLRARFEETTTAPVSSDFEQYTGPRVVIVGLFPRQVKTTGQVEKPLNGVTVYMQGNVELESPGVRVHVRGNTVVSDMRTGRVVFSVHVSALPPVNGEVSGDADRVYDGVNIETPDITVNIDRSTRVVREGRTLTIYVE